MKQAELEREADAFADRLSELLNGTLCRGLRITAASLPSGYVLVGLGVKKTQVRAQQIPLRGSGARVPLHLTVQYTLHDDDEGEHLMVSSSVLGLCISEDGNRELFHADFERDKADGYPEAHLQVHATSKDWAAFLSDASNDSLNKIHLPAGGRRYRTTLEDMIEFLIAEGAVKPHNGWRDVITKHRADFEERQLRAAIRRNPAVAVAAVVALRSQET